MTPLAFATGWRVLRQRDGWTHVVPHLDTHAHALRPDCRCGPTQDTVNVRLFVHHAQDRREAFEHLRAM